MKAALSVVTMVVVGALAPAASAAPRHVVRAQQGAVRAELSYQFFSSTSNEWSHGRLRIWNGRRLLVERRVAYGADPSSAGLKQLWIRQLDGAGPPEVVFTDFSGGNCLCSTTWIYEGKRRVKAAWFWPPTLRDADGDGKPEVHGYQAFGASWGSRADYSFPVAVWSYANGAVHDITRSFPAEIQADQAHFYGFYQSRLAAGNVGGARDAIFAYVVDGYLLGQGDAAMAILQAAADSGRLDQPDGTVSTSEYMAQVRHILRKAGFSASPAPVAPEDDDDTMASAAAARHVIRAQLGAIRAELS